MSAARHQAIFRSGKDLVTVDAVVPDRQGQPIRDLHADDFLRTAGAFDHASVVLDIVRRGEEAPLAGAGMPLNPTGDPLASIAAATVTIRGVPPDEYVFRATVRGGAAPLQVFRLVRIG